MATVPVISLMFGALLGAGAHLVVAQNQGANWPLSGREPNSSANAALGAQVQSRDIAIEDLRIRLKQAERNLAESDSQLNKTRQSAVQLHTTLEKERKQADEKLALLNDAQEKLKDAFKALASEALQGNNQSFLELAQTSLEKYQETAKGDLDKRQQAIDALVVPVKESLAKVDKSIQEMEVAREGAYQGLTQQVTSLLETQRELRSETTRLVQALRAPQARGRWGEIQLRRVVELAGMLDHCDFFEQQSVDSENGRLRPDLLVRLPGRKNIVIDAKVPLLSFLDALETTDDKLKRDKLCAHAGQVREHMKQLSRKSYFEQFEPAPEFVVLFMPGEVFFSAALEYDPALIEAGVEQNVILATPTTLIALLRAVAYGWRQERLAENARDISNLGRELYKRLATLGEHFSKVGKNLAQATDAYNSAVGSLETRVLVTARRFADLHVADTGSTLDALPLVDKSPRHLQSPEFTATHVVSTERIDTGD